jgi:hypothetical protein
MQKIIFLDIDGVIWAPLFIQADEEEYRENIDYKLFLLQKIINATGAKIVLSSSWRRNTIEETIKKLNSDLPSNYTTIQDNLIGITIKAHSYIDKLYKVHLSTPRGVEIKQWIDVNIKNKNKNIDISEFRYVIFDDDDDVIRTKRQFYQM